MSTRSATIIRQEQTKWKLGEDGTWESDGKELAEVARFYRHCDGYPTGHGLHMATSFAATEERERECGRGWGGDWFQKAFGPFLTGDGLHGTGFEGWGAPTLEFEPKGMQHGDLEFLYAVTKRGGRLEIAMWAIGWDEDYDAVMAESPLFEGTPAEYITAYGEVEW